MTLRARFEGALDDWNRSVVDLNGAIADFTNDGLQTRSGTWILTMNQSKSDGLRSARRREEAARAALGRVIDDLHRLEGGLPGSTPVSILSGVARPSPHGPDAAH